MRSGRSTLARQVRVLRSGELRAPAVFGLVVHTTGSGIVDQARARGVDPLEYAVEYYLRPDAFFPHYVCGWDGSLVQVADEQVKAQHVGFKERARYLEIDWETDLPRELADRWRAAWPAFPSPAHLFPGPSPNAVYCGVELLPLAVGDPAAAFLGARYTLAQHQAVVLLARDLAERHGWPTNWWAGPRLLGHEDVNPIARSAAGAGWDPGALRSRPWFSWRWVRELAAGRDPGAIAA